MLTRIFRKCIVILRFLRQNALKKCVNLLTAFKAQYLKPIMFKAYYYEFLRQAFIVRAVTDYLSY